MSIGLFVCAVNFCPISAFYVAGVLSEIRRHTAEKGTARLFRLLASFSSEYMHTVRSVSLLQSNRRLWFIDRREGIRSMVRFEVWYIPGFIS